MLKKKEGQIELTIILVNWNTRMFLHHCLVSIYQAVGSMVYEIFVVDNGSTDGSVEMVRNSFPTVNLIANSENLGFSRANNQAIIQSRGHYVILLNPDTIVFPDTFVSMKVFMEEHKNVGLVGCKVLNEDGSLQKYTAGVTPLSLKAIFNHYFFLSKMFPRSSFFKGIYLSFDYDTPQKVDWLQGVCLMARKSGIDSVGLLDESFFMYYEDVDWCYRFKKHGWDVYYLPSASIIHYLSQSTNQLDGEFFSSINTAGLLYRKHRGRISFLIFRGIIICGYSLRICLGLLAYLIFCRRIYLEKISFWYLRLKSNLK